jgi:hypothetical protein
VLVLVSVVVLVLVLVSVVVLVLLVPVLVVVFGVWLRAGLAACTASAIVPRNRPTNNTTSTCSTAGTFALCGLAALGEQHTVAAFRAAAFNLSFVQKTANCSFEEKGMTIPHVDMSAFHASVMRVPSFRKQPN